jgi:hypothetical protein
LCWYGIQGKVQEELKMADEPKADSIIIPEDKSSVSAPKQTKRVFCPRCTNFRDGIFEIAEYELCYSISETKGFPSKSSIFELIQWSFKQCQEPKFPQKSEKP